jgi:hypothetical protein
LRDCALTLRRPYRREISLRQLIICI